MNDLLFKLGLKRSIKVQIGTKIKYWLLFTCIFSIDQQNKIETENLQMGKYSAILWKPDKNIQNKVFCRLIFLTISPLFTSPIIVWRSTVYIICGRLFSSFFLRLTCRMPKQQTVNFGAMPK